MRIIRRLSIVSVVLFAFGLTACSDSGTGTEPGQPPELPNIKTYTSVDISYFKNNNPGANLNISGDIYSNFRQGKAVALSVGSMLFLSKSLVGYYEFASRGEPTFKDGAWIWKYEFSKGSWTLKAFQIGPRFIDWELNVTIHTKDLDLENFKLMSGRVSRDGREGSWQFNAFVANSESHLTFDWTAKSKTNRSFSFKLYDKDGTLTSSANFLKNDTLKKVIYKNHIDQVTLEVGWDTSTKTGYYMGSEGVKHCWNANYQNTPCS